MERRGVRVDAAALRQQSAELAQRLHELEQQAYAMAGERFNLGSPRQLQAVLFERLGLPAGKKTATGQASTAEDVLQELALEYPLPRLILEHRTLSKLKSTYTDRLPEQIHPRTGRIHTSYHQAVAVPGGSHPPIPICRTSRSAPPKDDASARPLCQARLGDARCRLFAD